MRKKFIAAAMVALTAAGAYMGAGTLTRSTELSELQLANIEALAEDESSTVCKWQRLKDDHGCWYHECRDTGDGDLCLCGQVDY